MELYKLKNYMDTLVSKYNVPGVDCIVYKNHEQIFRYFTGVSDLEVQKPLQGDELYLIFSMTKMLTCVSALQLMEEGKFLLNDPVSMYLPEFEKMKLYDGTYAQTPITVKHLFTMSAGLDYNINTKAILEAKEQGKTSTRELVAAIAKSKLLFEPGTRYKYSLCHDVLGALIEVWSGQKFSDYMKEHILDPLGMKRTFFGTPTIEQKVTGIVSRYSYDENGIPQKNEPVCPYYLSDDYQSGGAGLVSCTEDYAIFLDAMACGGVGKNGARIISSETIELMKINQLSENQLKDFAKRTGYGYGLGVRTHMDKAQSGSLSPVGEFGWDGAAGGFAMVDTTNQLSLTYFQHVHNWDLRIQTEMRNALYSDLNL